MDVPANGCLYLKAPQPSAEEKERLMKELQLPLPAGEEPEQDVKTPLEEQAQVEVSKAATRS